VRDWGIKRFWGIGIKTRHFLGLFREKNGLLGCFDRDKPEKKENK